MSMRTNHMPHVLNFRSILVAASTMTADDGKETMESESSQLEDGHLPMIHTLVPVAVEATATTPRSRDTLDLGPGENWLIFQIGENGELSNLIVHNTQSSSGKIPMGAPTDAAFLTLDIDGELAAIKDVGLEPATDIEATQQTEIYIARSGKGVLMIPSTMEKLEKRRLVHLNHKDQLVIRTSGDSEALVLEYRREHSIRMTTLAPTSSAALTEQTSGSVAFCNAPQTESTDQTAGQPAALDGDLKKKSSTSLSKAAASEQLVTQPEDLSDKDAEMTEIQVQSELNEERLASQPAKEADDDAKAGMEPEQHSSDEETVDPDEEDQTTADHQQTKDMEATDTTNQVESQVSTVLSPPADTMGETQPLAPPPLEAAPLEAQEDRLSYVDDDDDSSLGSECVSRHLTDNPPRNKLLKLTKVNAPPSGGDKNATIASASKLDANATSAASLGAVGESVNVKIKQVKKPGASAEDELSRPARRMSDTKVSHNAKRDKSSGDDKPHASSKPSMPLVEALIRSTKATTPRASAFDYDSAPSFDEDDAIKPSNDAEDAASEHDETHEANATRIDTADVNEQEVTAMLSHRTHRSSKDKSEQVPSKEPIDASESTKNPLGAAPKSFGTSESSVAGADAKQDAAKKRTRARSAKSKPLPAAEEAKSASSGVMLRKRATRTEEGSSNVQENARSTKKTKLQMRSTDEDNDVTDESSPSTPVTKPQKKRPPSKASATPSSSRPTRKRKTVLPDTPTEVSPKTRTSESKNKKTIDKSDAKDIRILATKIQLTDKQLKMINKIPGATWIDTTEDAHLATHVIASDGKQQLKRTPKLMIAMNKTTNIVVLDWFTESAKAGEALPCDKFLVNDKKAEKEYCFSMKETLERIQDHLENDTPVLCGRKVYICKGVAGNKAPKENELRCIVEAAGGQWLPNLKSLSASQIEDAIIITSADSPDKFKQAKVAAVANAIKQGARHRSTSWVFDVMMTQRLNLDDSA